MVVGKKMKESEKATSRLHIGIDIGGTFTDFVVYDEKDASLRTFKVLSTPSDPAEAVLKGLESMCDDASRTIVHGSTIATNALLERKGACTALVTTRGFGDILTIGRQTRSHLYDWFSSRPNPLVPTDRCLEMSERVDHRGCVLTPLSHEEFPALLMKLRAHQVEAVAVSFLFSFAHPGHEAWLTKCLREAGFFVSASHELVPEFREYERTSTTVINAYVSPILHQYLSRLDRVLAPSEFHIMQSNGGRLQASQAHQLGIRSILSGPAGGVVGGRHMARLAGFHQVITFDMGGTSTDVSLVDEEIRVTSEAEIGGLPIRVPVIDIHTVGAGGGSLAVMDQGGALRVGPESAGADPGPVCYGRGGQIPTVTDANFLLGRLPSNGLLNGQMALEAAAASKALDELAHRLGVEARVGMSEGQAVALGIIEVVNAQMERAIRVISVECGYDPRDYVLVSFGGAGGAHACALARRMGIRQILIPPTASTLSALGMLVADIQLNYVRTIMRPGHTSYEELEQEVSLLVTRGWAELQSQGVARHEGDIQCELDLRYVGQSFELSVPFTPAFRAAFDEVHDRRYGYSDKAAPVEIVNVRVQAVGKTTPPPFLLDSEGSPDPSGAFVGEYPLVLESEPTTVPHYSGERLRPGNRIAGPALIVREDTTILLNQADRAAVDRYHNLIVDVGG